MISDKIVFVEFSCVYVYNLVFVPYGTVRQFIYGDLTASPFTVMDTSNIFLHVCPPPFSAEPLLGSEPPLPASQSTIALFEINDKCDGSNKVAARRAHTNKRKQSILPCCSQGDHHCACVNGRSRAPHTKKFNDKTLHM